MLGLYELPASILGYLQVLLYPVVLVLAIGLPILTNDFAYLLLIFLALPVNFIIVFATNRTLRSYAPHLLTVTVLMNAAMLIEHVAMLSAIRRHLLRRELGWTNWQRQGLAESSTATPMPELRPLTTRLLPVDDDLAA